jgi:hypothetical protein
MDSDSCCPSAKRLLNIKLYEQITSIILNNMLKLCKNTVSIFAIIAYFKIILNQVSDKNILNQSINQYI